MSSVNLQRADARKIGRRWLLASSAAAVAITLLALGAGAWLLEGAVAPATGPAAAGAGQLARTGSWLLLIQTAALAAMAAAFLGALWTLHRQLVALAESRERNRAIVDNMVDGAIHIDAQGRLVALNAAAERMFQRDSAEVRGTPLSTLLSRAHGAEIEALIRTAANSEPDTARSALNDARELAGLRRDGSEFPLYLALSEVHVGAQPVLTAIARDLTETRRRMQELAEARDQAMAADRAKSQFLAVMSHEIRTPMNGILGMLDLLRDGSLSPQQREFIDTAEQSSQVLLGIINDMLDLSKIEAGKLELQHMEFDLRATVEEVTAFAARYAREKGLAVAHVIEQDVPAAVVGDPFRLRQVLMSLANNALKFTLRGEVVVHVAALEAPAGRARIRISVRDTGIGIDEDVQRQLFRPFSQADASTTRRFGGTGLGLALSKRLVDLMGGEIGVESAPGRGSTFWFTLDLERAAEPSEQPAADLRGARVLIVDENAANRLLLDDYVGNWGAESHSVAGGVEALRTLQRAHNEHRPFALAILDMEMPVLRGQEATREIRRQEGQAGRASVPIIAMTASTTAAERKACLALGMNDCIAKPVQRDELEAVLRRWLPQRAPPAEADTAAGSRA